MNVLHVAYSFFPDAPGGTEIYVDSLCRSLWKHEIDSIVSAPGAADEAYVVDGLPVRRFGFDDALPLSDLYSGDPRARDRFAQLLDVENPDVVHLHALSPACSPLLAIEARRRNTPVVFTYHTPTATCQRGTLIEGGTKPCDGRLEVHRCASCALENLGAGRGLANVIARTPAMAGEWLGHAQLGGGAWTALRMSSLVARRHESLHAFFTGVDRIVALTPWVEQLLTLNGVACHKIVRSPHGIAPLPSYTKTRRTRERLRLVHVGRADPTKGTDVLIRALREIPEAPIELDVFGVVQHDAASGHLESLRQLAEGDARIRFLSALPHRELRLELTKYDMAVVPSQWMETGPLVVLEANAAGIPVIGSALGGIADKVRHDIDGLLVQPYAAVVAWAAALQRCVDERDLVSRLAGNVRMPRSSDDVAADMAAVYAELVAR